MYVIGITGGVGSGKSYAAHRLQEKLGATLLIADELGHVVMEPGRSAYCQIVEHFGQNIVSLDGSIDRAVTVCVMRYGLFMYRRRSGSGVWHRTAVILNRNQRRSSKARFRKHCCGRKYSALFQMMEQKKIWSGHWMRCLQPLIPLH